MKNFLNVGHATKTFPKYPYPTFKDDKKETPPKSTKEPTTQNKTAELLPSNRYIPPQERMRLSAMAEESSRPITYSSNQKITSNSTTNNIGAANSTEMPMDQSESTVQKYKQPTNAQNTEHCECGEVNGQHPE